MDKPLMPKATAVWLVENTSLTFEQIADFCGLHSLEVKGIADGEVATGFRGLDPVGAGMLTRAEIARCELDPKSRLKISRSVAADQKKPKRKEPRYTPLSKRQDRPDAIAWLLRNHPELPDAAIMKLVGTTKPTIQSIRDRTHWNSVNIKPVDPVTLGLCSQLELDFEVNRANKEKPVAQASGATLLPASETTRKEEAPVTAGGEPEKKQGDLDVSAVFAKLKQLGGDKKPDGDQ